MSNMNLFQEQHNFNCLMISKIYIDSFFEHIKCSHSMDIHIFEGGSNQQPLNDGRFNYIA